MLGSGSALFLMETQLARGDEGVKRERAEFGACRRTPPKMRQAVTAHQWSVVLG